jgi:hypothetical protein
MIEITAQAGSYRKGLVEAAGRLASEEAEIIADLEKHGMQVPQLRDVLCGGHVLIDDPTLYEAWSFPQKSHHRISSHHHDIDKDVYPDIGMTGSIVREKLHGRTSEGTWVQLEKTPAAMGSSKIPTLNDVKHLWDYAVYRVTRSNVGPWGLSRVTERRPLYLSPSLARPAQVSPSVAQDLMQTFAAIEKTDDTTSASSDLAGRFPPPDRSDASAEMRRSIEGRAGRGLFGNSDVFVTETPSPIAEQLLREGPQAPDWTPPAPNGAHDD